MVDDGNRDAACAAETIDCEVLLLLLLCWSINGEEGEHYLRGSRVTPGSHCKMANYQSYHILVCIPILSSTHVSSTQNGMHYVNAKMMHQSIGEMRGWVTLMQYRYSWRANESKNKPSPFTVSCVTFGWNKTLHAPTSSALYNTVPDASITKS